MVARRLQQPPAEGAGEALPAAEVHHEAGQEAAGRHPRTHRRPGEGLVPEQEDEVAALEGGGEGGERGGFHPGGAAG